MFGLALCDKDTGLACWCLGEAAILQTSTDAYSCASGCAERKTMITQGMGASAEVTEKQDRLLTSFILVYVIISATANVMSVCDCLIGLFSCKS